MVKHFLYYFVILTFLNSCKDHEDITKETVDQLNNASSSIKEIINKAEAPEELKKLNRFEYKILSFSDKISYPAMEERLNDLGKSGWDCTPSVTNLINAAEKQQTQFFCKKRPESFLKYFKQLY